MEEISEENECSIEVQNEHHRKQQYPCGCSNLKFGLLAAGVTELVIGTTGLALILLNPQERHTILYPLEDQQHKVEIYSEQWEDVIQLLIEFWLPSLAYWVLGAILLLTAFTQRSSYLISWVFISTLLLAGSVAGILALIVAGASVIGVLPLILATMIQIYFYLVISDITYFQWRTTHTKPDDKLILVDSTV